MKVKINTTFWRLDFHKNNFLLYFYVESKTNALQNIFKNYRTALSIKIKYFKKKSCASANIDIFFFVIFQHITLMQKPIRKYF